jgi:hypothetical protein
VLCVQGEDGNTIETKVFNPGDPIPTEVLMSLVGSQTPEVTSEEVPSKVQPVRQLVNKRKKSRSRTRKELNGSSLKG